MLHHYHCIQASDIKTKATIITDTSYYLHEYLTQPTVTPEDRITYAIHFLYTALKDVPTSLCDSQPASIEAVRAIFEKWRTLESSPTVPYTALTNPTKPIVPLHKTLLICYPAPTSKGDHGQDRVTTSKAEFNQQTPVTSNWRKVAVNSKDDQEPIAARTRSQVAPPPSLPQQPLN